MSSNTNRDSIEYTKQKQGRAIAFYANQMELGDPMALVINRPKRVAVASQATILKFGRNTQLSLTTMQTLASIDPQFAITSNPKIYKPIKVVESVPPEEPSNPVVLPSLSGYIAIDNNGYVVNFSSNFTTNTLISSPVPFTTTIRAVTCYFNGSYILALENDDYSTANPIRLSKSENLQTWTTPQAVNLYNVIHTKDLLWDTNLWYMSGLIATSPFQRFLTSSDALIWTQTSQSITILSIGYYPLSIAKNGNTILIGFDSSTNSLWRSADNGVTFTNVSPSAVSIISKIMYINGAWYTFGAYARAFWKSTNDGVTWVATPMPDYVIWNAIYDGSKIIYENLSGYNYPGKGLLYSLNFGSTILSCVGNDTIPDSSTFEYYGCLKRLYYNGTTYSWFNPNSGKAWKSTDGINWSELTHPSGGTNTIRSIFPIQIIDPQRTKG